MTTGTTGGNPDSYLARLRGAELDQVLRLGTPASKEPGELLLREEEESRHVLLILDGWVKVALPDSDGRGVLLSLRGPGSVVGELAAIDGHPRLARVTAGSRVRLRVITREAFLRHLESAPGAALALLGVVADRLRASDRSRLRTAVRDTPDRLAALLLELLAYGSGQGPVPTRTPPVGLTQTELADALGVSPRTAARALRTLREEGAVETRRRAVVVLSPAKLAARAAGGR
ncbi:Crp/Fnr family transcriptional regulator [Streptomyces purpureus]|uniref:Crp/Fnr family transcriptional regulator n=1 Tax=Streptomyces purpureus TaxID=1951 RepID=A0A918H3K4_9ACTN|nr:Crp/Fnr family transcriptional regulator [Streptomyces purpureus]GGT34049.1 Crp/Fnr family transcriptional regulator [Streptomyces purpureus]